MSEEVARAMGDIAHWKRRAEQAEALAKTLQHERDQAEADAAQLMNIVLDATIWLDQLSSADGSGHHDLAHRLREIIDTHQYSGAALLTELQAARAYLGYVLETYPPTSTHESALRADYENTVKASGE